MIANEKNVADSLAAAVTRIDAVLSPWGFVFTADDVRYSHCGYYASGHYCRGMTRIGLSCRETIDNLFYEHSFIKEFAFHQEKESCILGHGAFMKALGHSEDCHLIACHDIRDAIIARDGGDRVAALIHDLNLFAAPVLREPSEEFYAVMRRKPGIWSIV